jgi:NAD(P)-dependent dehydrogenase (short-subunit alcohol dehydrogenase family)
MSVVLITGCSSGFGLDAAIAFAQRGDTVVATMRNLAKAERLQKKAAEAGVEVELEQLDVTDDASVTAACAAVLERHGRVDVVVNNAGVGGGGPTETQDFDMARGLFETNFWGPQRVIRATLPAMREQRSGVIINVGSLAGRVPGIMYTSMYGASKHALGTLSEALASEVEPFGVRVVNIEPGFFATDISANNISADEDQHPAYAVDQAWARSFFESGVEDGADPMIVAHTIVDAAYDENTPLHVPVGEDAAMYLSVLDQTNSFEEWTEVGTQLIEGVAGPRPSQN